MQEDKSVFTVPEVAEKLRCSTWLVYRLVQDGKLPALRIGSKKVMIPRVALERLLEASAVKS